MNWLRLATIVSDHHKWLSRFGRILISYETLTLFICYLDISTENLPVKTWIEL